MNLIVFDIDDTLTKSEYQHQLAYVNAMKACGIININQNWRDYTHHTDSHILKVNYEKNLTEAFSFEFVEMFEKRMTENLLMLSKVSEIKGAKEIVTMFINQSDYAIAFATGSLLKPALIKLTQAGIEHDERLVVGSNTFFSREEIVQSAITQAREFYQVHSFEHIISVGDGIWDFKTARNLGLHFIGIGNKNLLDFEAADIQYHIEDWQSFSIEEMESRLTGIR